MTDRDDLEALLADTPPPKADSAKRTRDLAAAMTAFDEQARTSKQHAAEKNSNTAQGTADIARPTVRQPRLTRLWRWMMTMDFELPSTRVMMMGTASIAVMVLAIGAFQTQIGDQLGGGTEIGIGNVSGLSSKDAGTLLSEAESELSGTASVQISRESLSAQTLLAPPAPPVEADAAMDLEGFAVLREERALSPEPSAQVLTAAPRSTPAAPATTRQRAKIAAGCTAGTAACQQGGGAVPLGVPVKRKAESAASVGATVAPQDDAVLLQPQEQGRDRFEDIEPNQIKVTAEEPVSTFSIDVDTASYAFTRGALMQGVLPPKDAVRIEELINYFPYDYAPPEDRSTPFATHVSVMPTPWNGDTQLMRIGIKGYELAETEKPRSNLVFLLDTSGSMNQPNKLPLLKNAFRMLVQSLDPDDTVSIVTYAGSAGTVLEPTKAKNANTILAALDRLNAGGSTAGGEGIRQAYRLAEANFDKDGVNRVILATDGDFNVGISNPEQLKDFVERKRDTGVFLSVLGFGRGNYNDQLMQVLAQNGNGTAAYIDTLNEARKVMVEEAGSTLFPIAKDVKIQIEFNPATVAEYRLIGFETRILNREDFNNDKIDAGEIGSGHTVTALYEITPVGSEGRQVDDLRYQQSAAADGPTNEYGFLKIRYKQPDGDTSKLIQRPVTRADEANPDSEVRFASAVAAFGQLLRGGRHTGGYGYDDVIELATASKGEDPFGYRAEFVNLVRLAKSAAALPQQRQ
ncbi:MAG: von Willebrand factor type A domain-containing protein [Pseudomonadota bacterium]